MVTRTRHIERLIHSHPSQDGAGVNIKRIHRFDGELDPFLMLDELGSDRPDDYIGGFPPHPHRGIQTLTYIVHGGITHEDHLGHSSTIQAGGAQWMHTGRGIVHSEMPLTDSQGLHGFQLWLNLPASEKMSEPRYRDVPSGEMPRLPGTQAELVALGGRWSTLDGDSVSGPLDALAGDGAVSHVRLEAGGELTLSVQSEMLAVHVFEGELQIAGENVAAGQLARLGAGDTLELSSRGGAQCLLLSGTPHREPIAHYGPFVMNHMHEIDQALQDYRSGNFTE
ncbi:pirin family protein [Billgrantia kenyensis]|uniref:Pirin family protein n=1 Tax=Billgrantia kenyensis TaxID=321266 RepID=A0A7W0AFA9_9GAMM|nr:pirin family protein [Halomonas kenyensis]MBA2780460.1 pirin family protein [Halomonas kenyensis]MCG6662374.1 pirin family protein [Halomonas kenyensis]